MGRPRGTKNIMRTPEEKERIVLEYLNGYIGEEKIAEKYEISYSLFRTWRKKYQEKGIDGFKSQTGKKRGEGMGRPKNNQTEVEKLKKQLAEKEVEIERLKKGYQVKGVGAQKEYVTTFDANME